jgi:hypothetical protein
MTKRASIHDHPKKNYLMGAILADKSAIKAATTLVSNSAWPHIISITFCSHEYIETMFCRSYMQQNTSASQQQKQQLDHVTQQIE